MVAVALAYPGSVPPCLLPDEVPLGFPVRTPGGQGVPPGESGAAVSGFREESPVLRTTSLNHLTQGPLLHALLVSYSESWKAFRSISELVLG